MAIWKDGKISIEIASLAKTPDPHRLCKWTFSGERDIMDKLANRTKPGPKVKKSLHVSVKQNSLA